MESTTRRAGSGKVLTLAVLAALLALLALGVWFALAPAHDEHDAANSARESSDTALTTTDPAAIAREALVRNAADTAQSAPAPVVLADEPPPRCTIFGRVLRPGGKGADNVSVSIRAAPEDIGWNDPGDLAVPVEQRARTAADGKFSLTFAPAFATSHLLAIDALGCAPIRWRWPELRPGAHIDLGEIELVLAGAITGHIVDARGRALRSGWRVRVTVRETQLHGTGKGVEIWVPADADTGAFRCEGVPAGAIEVAAFSTLATWTAAVKTDVRAGETTNVELLYDGLDVATRIVVRATYEPLPELAKHVENVALDGPGGQRQSRATSSRHEFDGLAPGTYSATITDPNFEPWHQEAMSPGSIVVAKLRGSARVVLTVVDAETQARVENYRVLVRRDDAELVPNTYAFVTPDGEPPAGGLIDALFPGSVTLIVRSKGHVDCYVRAFRLAPGETRALTARLGAGAGVEGKIVEADRMTPAPRVTVELAACDAEFAGRGKVKDTTLVLTAASDAEGKFVFNGIANGMWSIRARREQIATPWFEVDLGDGDSSTPLLIPMPPAGRLHGRVRGPDGTRFDTFALRFDYEERQSETHAGTVPDPPVQIALAADGKYETGALLTGRWRASLVFPKRTVVTQSRTLLAYSETLELGTVRISAGGNRREDFDAALKWPGSLRVRVRGIELAPGDGIVRAREARWDAGTLALVDEHGEAHFPFLLPGERFVDVASEREGWTHVQPNAVKIKPGAETVLDVDVQLIDGVIAVRDAAGAPVVSRAVTVTTLFESGGTDAHLRTDERGELHLRRAPGKLRINWSWWVRMGQPAEAKTHEPCKVEWTANGPVPAMITLPELR